MLPDNDYQNAIRQLRMFKTLCALFSEVYANLATLTYFNNNLVVFHIEYTTQKVFDSLIIPELEKTKEKVTIRYLKGLFYEADSPFDGAMELAFETVFNLRNLVDFLVHGREGKIKDLNRLIPEFDKGIHRAFTLDKTQQRRKQYGEQ